jgi:signal transduction histidine kinase/CheY-like chemotaxis protein
LAFVLPCITLEYTVFPLRDYGLLREDDTRLQEQLLLQWAGQARYSPPPIILSISLIAFMASQYISAWIWASWWCIAVAAQGWRWYVFRQLPTKAHIPIRKRIRMAIVVNFCSSLCNNVSLVWFPLFTPFQAAVQSLLILSTGVASALMGVGFAAFALTHILFGLLPMFGLWAWSGIWGEGGITALAVMVIGLCHCAFAFRLSGHIFRLYKESFEVREQLEDALVRAEAAGRAKTRFLASASHDLRQPIHALALFSAALTTRKLDDGTSHIVDNINASVAALSYELDGLLDISKLDAGIVIVSRTNFCLVSLLQRLREEFLPRAQQHNIALLLFCPERAFVNTDGALLERVLRNLITNAIHHNADCTVTLTLRPLTGAWQVVVADTGRGIALAEQDHIFEEFYQLENSERDRNKGLGLGLSIVRRLSDLLEIQMRFESTLGAGTQFAFTVTAAEQAQQRAPTIDPAGHVFESLSVLVVDDEQVVREGMRTLLESLGCRVITADSSEKAIDVATVEKPDLALVDLRLRNHDDGLVTIGRLRDLYPGLPAIVISGDTAPDRLLAIKTANIPLLIKPVLLGPLQEAILRSCSQSVLDDSSCSS